MWGHKILRMKRLFNTRKKSEEDVREQGNTLDRIVKDKEGVKKRLEEEEKSFMNKKREYERKRRKERHGQHRSSGLVAEKLIPVSKDRF